MRSALGELSIDGVKTNADFQYEILQNEQFERGNVNTHFIDNYF
jgi:acetyl-CoA carboxylase biotin carboxylase subunit